MAFDSVLPEHIPSEVRQIVRALGRVAAEHGLPNTVGPQELVDHYGCKVRAMRQPQVVQWLSFPAACQMLGMTITYEARRYRMTAYTA